MSLAEGVSPAGATAAAALSAHSRTSAPTEEAEVKEGKRRLSNTEAEAEHCSPGAEAAAAALLAAGSKALPLRTPDAGLADEGHGGPGVAEEALLRADEKLEERGKEGEFQDRADEGRLGADPGGEAKAMEQVYIEVVRPVPQQKRWLTGIICIVLVAVIWAGASILVQYIFQNRDFRAPFFLTYVCNSLFAVNLPVWYIALRFGYVADVPNGFSAFLGNYANIPSQGIQETSLQGVVEEDDGATEILLSKETNSIQTTTASPTQRDSKTQQSYNGYAARRRGSEHSINAIGSPEDTLVSSRGNDASENAQRTKAEIAKISLIICPLWFLANFTYNASLAMTSVTSSTVISNTSTLWTFVLSLCILKESFSWLKVLGVVFCVAGNLLTTLGDSKATYLGETVIGDLVCMFSAFMYGVYTVGIRRQIPDEAAVSLPLFFGFLGIINMILLAPIVVILKYTGAETLSGLSGEIFALIVAKGLMDNVVSDYLWALGVLLTTPTVATIGLSLTIPLAIVSDLLLHAILPTAVSIGAAVLVIAGFLTINLASQTSPDNEGAPETFRQPA